MSTSSLPNPDGHLRAVPLSIKAANAFVAQHHRHHEPVLMARFCIGAVRADQVAGVCIVSNPVSRSRDNGDRVEVTRLCTDGTPHVCSFLYSRAARVARAMGYAEILTYILDREPGTSLKAAGWTKDVVPSGGMGWTGRAGRIGRMEHAESKTLKQRWSKTLGDPVCARALERGLLPSDDTGQGALFG